MNKSVSRPRRPVAYCVNLLLYYQVYLGSKLCPLWKPLAFKFMLGCSMSSPRVKGVPQLLYVFQLLFARTLTYVQAKLFFLITFIPLLSPY